MSEYNYNDILLRLRKGETDADIAREMANTLNKAVKAYDAEKAAKSKKEETYKTACETATRAMNDALKAYGALNDIDMSEFYWDKKTCYTTIESYSLVKGVVNIVTNKNHSDFDSVMKKFLNDIGC